MTPRNGDAAPDLAPGLLLSSRFGGSGIMECATSSCCGPAALGRGIAAMARAAAAFCVSRWWALVQWHQRGRAVLRLEELEDRMLKDIGIHRSEIRSAVRGPDGDPSRIDRR